MTRTKETVDETYFLYIANMTKLVISEDNYKSKGYQTVIIELSTFKFATFVI